MDIKYSAGSLPHETMLRSIELLGTKVKPLVQEMLNGKVVPAKSGLACAWARLTKKNPGYPGFFFVWWFLADSNC